MAAPGRRLRVFVRGLALQASIGLHAHERRSPQTISIDLEVELAPRPVTGLSDTVDYARLAGFARELVAAGHIELVETLAARLAERCASLPEVVHARVRVAKLTALEGAEAAGAEVEISAGTGAWEAALNG